ncbi:MAG: GDSL-type esterase/lipase family protein [Spirochaetaceae bacterium]|nr:GDSL-type esterase/lipase family protein [Spirochaetaceae bacterium]
MNNNTKLIHDNIEFHNVGALERAENYPGIELLRFPKSISHQLEHLNSERARFVSTISTGCELRFVSDSETILLTLSARYCKGTVLIFNGDFFHSMRALEEGRLTTIKIEKSERFPEVKEKMLKGKRFNSGVWRIIMGRAYDPSGNFLALYHNIDVLGHNLRPPRKDELPGKTWLAYGSSITHGSGATNHHLCYTQLAAYYSGVDVLNKGMGGSCFAEKAMIDFLVSETVWDFATFEIGVNMRNSFSSEEYEKRLRYLLTLLEKEKPENPVVLITVFPNWNTGDLSKTFNQVSKIEDSFKEIMNRLYREFRRENLFLIEGDQLLTDTSALTADLIHPSDYGHNLIAGNLSKNFSLFGL